MQNVEFTTGLVRPVEIFREAWDLVRPQYWPLLGLTILGIVIATAVPIVLVGPMMCGIFLMMFRVIGGGKAGSEDLFKGFDLIWKSLPVSILMMAPVIVLIFVIYLPMIGFVIAGPRMGQAELLAFLGGWIIFEFIIILLMVCFHTLLMFAFPLVADRGLSAMDAVKLSIKAVRGNLRGVAGLLGLNALACLGGYMLLCVGIYFVIPIILMSQAIAYRRIFPAASLRGNLDPPAPGFYKDLT